MPYINQSRRDTLDQIWNPDFVDSIDTAGELNYIVTSLIKEYINRKRYIRDSDDYQDLNDVVGALEGAKMEFYRRVVRPYEDRKIYENGDVY